MRDMSADLQRLQATVTSLTLRLEALEEWDNQSQEPPIFGVLGLTATTGDVVTAVLEAARDARDAIETVHSALLNRAIEEGGQSDRALARAAGTTSPTVARRRTQRES